MSETDHQGPAACEMIDVRVPGTLKRAVCVTINYIQFEKEESRFQSRAEVTLDSLRKFPKKKQLLTFFFKSNISRPCLIRVVLSVFADQENVLKIKNKKKYIALVSICTLLIAVASMFICKRDVQVSKVDTLFINVDGQMDSFMPQSSYKVTMTSIA